MKRDQEKKLSHSPSSSRYRIWETKSRSSSEEKIEDKIGDNNKKTNPISIPKKNPICSEESSRSDSSPKPFYKNVKYKLSGSSGSLDNLDKHNFPVIDKKKYIQSITHEFQTKKFKKCIETEGAIIYFINENMQIFALKNPENPKELSQYYLLNKGEKLGEDSESVMYAAHDLITNKKITAKIAKYNYFSNSYRDTIEVLQRLRLYYGDCIFMETKDTEKQIFFTDFHYTVVGLDEFLYKSNAS
jgi:hypothetical protein